MCDLFVKCEAAFIFLGGHLGALHQAVNTILTYYHLIKLYIVAYLNVQQTQRTISIHYCTGCVSGHLMNVSQIFTLPLALFSTNS